VEICVRPEEPLPPDRFNCSDGTELPTVIAVNNTNCYDLYAEYQLQNGWCQNPPPGAICLDEIYNVNDGGFCPYGTSMKIGDTIRICKRTVTEPFVCNGVTIDYRIEHDQTPPGPTSCEAIAVYFDVNLVDIYHWRTGLTCPNVHDINFYDDFKICDTSGVAATISE
jgi:hypothetical protein